MIEVQHLCKSYGPSRGIQDISFTVNSGEVLGFLGPNGAGKSTTMNIITGYLSADSGRVLVCGCDILEQPIEAKRHIGYLPEQPPLYPDMTVAEYLDFIYELKGVKLARKEHIAEILQVVKIEQVYHRTIKNLSKGYRQRVGIAQALIGSPDVLILDEPTVGLDPKQIIEIRDLVRELGKKHTVILSSHILPEIQAVCERVIVINQGRLVADDTPDRLQKSLSTVKTLLLRVRRGGPDLAQLISALPYVDQLTPLAPREEDSLEYQLSLTGAPAAGGQDPRTALLSCLLQQGVPVVGLTRGELSLEDIFLQLTGDPAEGPAPAPGPGPV